MIRNMKKRLLALLCVVCMLAPLFLDGQPAVVHADEPAGQITLDSLKEQGYGYKTFYDVSGNDSANYKARWTDSDPTLMEKDIFAAVMYFPTGTFSEAWELGYSTESRFRIQDATSGDTDNFRIRYLDKKSGTLLDKEFSPEIAGVTLRGNSELTFAISVEFVGASYQKNGVEVVDFKVGFFFNDKLYNNQFFEVKGATKEHVMVKMIFHTHSSGKVDIASYYPWRTTIDALKSQGYSYQTVYDITGYESVNYKAKWTSKNPQSWDKNIFTAITCFPTGTFSEAWELGYSTESRFRIQDATSGDGDNFRIRYIDKNTGTLFDKEFSPEVARAKLRGNAELIFSISVEFVGEVYKKSGVDVVDLKVGFFFNGNLYEDQYYELKGATKDHAMLKMVFHTHTSGKTDITSHYPWGKTIDELEGKGFTCQTFYDLTGNEFANYRAAWNIQNPSSLDKTIFTNKIYFPTDAFSEAWELGYNTESRFRIQDATSGDTDNIRIRYIDKTSGTLLDKELSPEVAGAQLRGNSELTFAISVEFLGEPYQKSGVEVVDMKVGFFFNGNMYGNQYFTLKGATKDHVVFKRIFHTHTAGKKDIASHYPGEAIMNAEALREQGYDYWTLSDVGLSDQMLDKASGTISGKREGTTMDKTIFTAKAEFPQTVFPIWDIGYNTEHRFVLSQPANGNIKNLRLRYFGNDYAGKFGTLLDLEFTPEKAGVELRGNTNLTVSVSVTFTKLKDDIADMLVGVYFDDISDDVGPKLYNKEYFRISTSAGITGTDASRAKTNYIGINNTGTNAANFSVGSNYLWSKPMDTYRNGLTELKASDFNMTEGSFAKGTYSTASAEGSLNGTTVSMSVQFPTQVGSHLYLGGASKGIRLSTGENGNIILAYVNDSKKVTPIATLTPDVVGVSSLTGVDMDWQFVFAVNKEVSGSTFVNLGLYIAGNLYNGQYFTITNVNYDDFKQVISVDADGKFTISDVAYDELSFNSFSILDTTLETDDITDKKNGYKKTMYRDFDSLDGTAFTGIFNFPKTGTARFSLGGSDFWQGFIVNNLDGDSIRIQYVNAKNKSEYLVVVTPEKAGVASLKEQDVKIRLTFDLFEGANGTQDMKVCVYINDVLYDGKAYVAHDVADKTITKYCKLWAMTGFYKIQSVEKPISFETYGFTSNWKNEIKIGQ